MFIVIELQTYNDGTVGHIVTNYEERNVAESKFYQIMSAAAISDVPVHSALIVDEAGMIQKQDWYDRRPHDDYSYSEPIITPESEVSE